MAASLRPVSFEPGAQPVSNGDGLSLQRVFILIGHTSRSPPMQTQPELRILTIFLINLYDISFGDTIANSVPLSNIGAISSAHNKNFSFKELLNRRRQIPEEVSSQTFRAAVDAPHTHLSSRALNTNLRFQMCFQVKLDRP